MAGGETGRREEDEPSQRQPHPEGRRWAPGLGGGTTETGPAIGCVWDRRGKRWGRRTSDTAQAHSDREIG